MQHSKFFGIRTSPNAGFARAGIAFATALACSSESPEELLFRRCRHICNMGVTCYNPPGGMTRKENDICVERCADDRLDQSIEMSEECADDYQALVACYATWTCDEWRNFQGLDTQRCGPEHRAFDEKCPGIAARY